MAHSGNRNLLSSVAQSIREACQCHVQYRDYISVSGIICLDIDGHLQERLILTEVIPGNKDGNHTSFQLKTLKWTNIRKQSKSKTNGHKNSKKPDNQDNGPSNCGHVVESSSFSIAPLRVDSIENEGFEAEQECCKSPEKTPGSLNKRTDSNNLTFTKDTRGKLLQRRPMGLPPSDSPLALTFISKGSNVNKQLMEHNRANSSQNLVPKSKSTKRSHNNNTVHMKRFNSMGVLGMHTKAFGASASQGVGEENNEDVSRASAIENVELFDLESSFIDKSLTDISNADCSIDCIEPPPLVDHDSGGLGGFRKPFPSNTTAFSSLNDKTKKKGASSSAPMLASPRRAPKLESRIKTHTGEGTPDVAVAKISGKLKGRSGGKIVKKCTSGTMRDAKIKGPAFSQLQSGNNSASCKIKSMASEIDMPLICESPSVSSVGLQPSHKKKRLIRWMNIFKRGSLSKSQASNASNASSTSCSATKLNASNISDYTPSWATSISSIQR